MAGSFLPSPAHLRRLARRLLDIAVDASASEIKAAYRSKALKLHPDVNSAEDAAARFSEVSAAYGAHRKYRKGIMKGHLSHTCTGRS